MSERERETVPPPAGAAERLTEFGSAIGCGLIAALAGSGPAGLRLGDAAGDDGTRVWLLLAAAATPFTTVGVLVLREAYVGLRATMRDTRSFTRLFVTMWLAASAFALYALGAVLRTHTHHHPLAGVTFALVGAVVLLGAGVFTHRLAHVLESLRDRGHVRAHALVVTFAYAMVAVMLLWAARRLHTRLAPESAAAMVDVTALALASALAAHPEFRRVRALAVLGPVAALAIVVVGLTRASPDWVALVTQRAPAFGTLLHALGR